MGYFPNATAWEYWAVDNCLRCSHWPKTEAAPACPVELAHTLYSYELYNADNDPGKIILDMLIPPDGKGKCAMFSPRNGVTDRHLKDWEKYKAVMAEAAQAGEAGTAETRRGSVHEHAVAEGHAPNSPDRHTKADSV